MDNLSEELLLYLRYNMDPDFLVEHGLSNVTCISYEGDPIPVKGIGYIPLAVICIRTVDHVNF